MSLTPLDVVEEQLSPILFARQRLGGQEDVFVNYFSVPSPNQRLLKSNAIVIHNDLDTGAGVWVCNKDPIANCTHIAMACHMLQKLITVNLMAKDNMVNVESTVDHNGELNYPLTHDIYIDDLVSATCSGRKCHILLNSSTTIMGLTSK